MSPAGDLAIAGATPFSRRGSGQPGVAPVLVKISFVVLELPHKIALVPKQDSIEILAPYHSGCFIDRGCAVAVPIAHYGWIHRCSVRCTRWHDRGKHPQRTNSGCDVPNRYPPTAFAS